MIDYKICKSQGRAKGFNGCGKKVQVKFRKFGLCSSCLWEWMCTNENGKVWRETQFIPRVKKLTEKEQRKKKRQERENMKSIQRLIQEARKPFQKFIRLRDINRGCISCGDVNAEIWDAGHYFKAELFSGLIFDEQNCHKQCRKCNVYLNGNESEYIKRLNQRYGELYVHNLTGKANPARQYKFSREELLEIKSYYQKKVREFSKELETIKQ